MSSLFVVFMCVHVLEGQVMKDMTKFFKIIEPNKFQDLESQVLGMYNMSKFGSPSLAWHVNHIGHCIHVLEDQVMKEINLGKGLILKIFNPKGVET